jgi:hypothetical protein
MASLSESLNSNQQAKMVEDWVSRYGLSGWLLDVQRVDLFPCSPKAMSTGRFASSRNVSFSSKMSAILSHMYHPHRLH